MKLSLRARIAAALAAALVLLGVVGTAAYRERPVDAMMQHLGELSDRHGVTRFYFSQDSVSPKTALKLARAIRDAQRPWRWATDMRPEKSLTPERCQELRLKPAARIVGTCTPLKCSCRGSMTPPGALIRTTQNKIRMTPTVANSMASSSRADSLTSR